jgi:menaquinone-specific isochorismate synthase
VSRPAAGLRAVRMPLEPGPAIEPFSLAGEDGMVFRSGPRTRVGLGSALTVELPRGLESAGDLAAAQATLASIATVDHLDGADRPGRGTGGVVAFGSLPFDRSAPASLVVPEIVYGSDDDGREWITVIGAGRPAVPSGSTGLRSWLAGRSRSVGHGEVWTPPGHGGATGGRSDVAGAGADPPAGLPLIVPRGSDDAFRSAVAEALRSIGRGDVAKVVLARRVDVTMGRDIAVTELLRRWVGLEPNCAVFSVPTSEGQFVGASPELLVERTGPHLRSRPLAGTTGRSVPDASGALPCSLLSSSKDNHEHRLVVEAIDGALRPLCAELEVPDQPGLVHLRNITHLGTPITGTLAVRRDGTMHSALELVAALHPTPAVGGVPRQRALALIDRLEPGGRGHFAGPVGYVDASGDGVWMVGIRSMTVLGPTARLAAGVGIVVGSDPDRELRETNLKLTAVFDALAPGLAFATSGPSTSGSPGRHEAVS